MPAMAPRQSSSSSPSDARTSTYTRPGSPNVPRPAAWNFTRMLVLCFLSSLWFFSWAAVFGCAVRRGPVRGCAASLRKPHLVPVEDEPNDVPDALVGAVGIVGVLIGGILIEGNAGRAIVTLNGDVRRAPQTGLRNPFL